MKRFAWAALTLALCALSAFLAYHAGRIDADNEWICRANDNPIACRESL